MGHALGNNYGKFYSFLSKPVELDLNFIVDKANGNGAGVRSVKGQGVKNVFMATSASFTGTSHTSTLIDSIASGTSSLKPGMAVAGSGIAAGSLIQSIAGPNSIILTKATSSSTSGTITYTAAGSPMLNSGVGAASVGLCLIELEYNYTRIYGGPMSIISPNVVSNIAINSTALTVGSPYVIISVGHGAAGAATIAPVADSSGSLASTWFQLFDSYGNMFVIYYIVNGVGSAPSGTGGILVPVALATNATADNITTALSTAINALPSGISGVSSFTTSGGGGSTLTVTSTANAPLSGPPQDGVIATGATFALTVFNTNLENWQAVGVPKGVVPAVGVSFIATATGQSTGGGSTGIVWAPSVSGIISAETIGDPNASLGPIPMGGSPNTGGWILIQFLAPTVSGSAYDTPMIPTAPADNTVASFSFLLEQAARVGGNNE